MPMAARPAAARSAAARYSANVIVRFPSSVRNSASGDSWARRSTSSHNLRAWIMRGLYCCGSGHRYGLRAPVTGAAAVQAQEVAADTRLDVGGEETLGPALAVGRHGSQVVGDVVVSVEALGDLDGERRVGGAVLEVELHDHLRALLIELGGAEPGGGRRI